MTEIWFYHLQSQPLERALPVLVEKARERDWCVVVETVDDLRVKALDDLLWTYAAESFLPHGIAGDKAAARQPVLVTRDSENPNRAALRICVEGAELVPSDDYERMILLFDGGNEAEFDAARRQWTRLKGEGRSLAYWRQTDSGKWSRQT